MQIFVDQLFRPAKEIQSSLEKNSVPQRPCDLKKMENQLYLCGIDFCLLYDSCNFQCQDTIF